MYTAIRLLATLALCVAASGVAAAPWGNASAAEGKPLHDDKCTSCHVRMYGGDGSRMYTRDGRLLSNRLELLQRVAACNAQVSAGWFPDEEAAVAAWLNQTYYHFED